MTKGGFFMKHINNPLRSEGKLNIVGPRTRSNIFTQVDQDHPAPSQWFYEKKVDLGCFYENEIKEVLDNLDILKQMELSQLEGRILLLFIIPDLEGKTAYPEASPLEAYWS